MGLVDARCHTAQLRILSILSVVFASEAQDCYWRQGGVRGVGQLK